MRTSQAGIDLIKRFEDFRARAYQDSAGVWTIGYGTTAGAGVKVRPGMTISRAQAEEYLRDHLQQVERAVDRLVTVPLEQHEFDALVSFVYNVGGGAFAKSTLRRKLNAGDRKAAANEFLRWNKAGGKVLKGLKRRRAAERRMFLGKGPKPKAKIKPKPRPWWLRWVARLFRN